MKQQDHPSHFNDEKMAHFCVVVVVVVFFFLGGGGWGIFFLFCLGQFK